MAKFDSSLDNLKVASPCSQDWNAMIGDDRKRYCGECKLNVFNLSGMSKTEAENLIMNSEGRLCVRFYKRADGSVITQDCPVGWAKVKQRTRAYVTAAVSLVFSFFGTIGLVGVVNKTSLSDDIAVATPTPKSTPRMLMGAIAPTTPKPTPKRTPKPTPKNKPIMGKIAIPRENRQMIMGEIEERKN